MLLIRVSPAHVFDLHLNTHSRLNCIGALLDVIDEGADQAIRLDQPGVVASCNATSLFWVKAVAAFISPDEFCFKGITLSNMIALCREGVAPLRQGDGAPDDLPSGPWLTQTIAASTRRSPRSIINERAEKGHIDQQNYGAKSVMKLELSA